MLNGFEAGSRKVIPAVLIYGVSKIQNGVLGERWLMVHRTVPGSVHSGKWNGLGGKLELDESPFQAALREFEEEAGVRLVPEQLRAIGSLYFPNFKPAKNEDWAVTVFVAELLPHQVSAITKSNTEGELFWIPTNEMTGLNLWPGDKEFLPKVLRREPFLGSFWYKEGLLEKFELSSIGS